MHAAAGASGKGDNHRHFKGFSQPHGIAEQGIVTLGDASLWVYRVAMAGERADRKTTVLQAQLVLTNQRRSAEQRRHVDVARTRPSARADLEHADCRILRDFLQELVKVEPVENRGEQANPHTLYLQLAPVFGIDLQRLLPGHVKGFLLDEGMGNVLVFGRLCKERTEVD